MEIITREKDNLGQTHTLFKEVEVKATEQVETNRDYFIKAFLKGVNEAQREGDSTLSKAFISIRMNRHPSYVPFKEKKQLWFELLGLCKQDGYSWWWNKTKVK